MPSASGRVVAGSTASMAPLGASGPLGWRASEARAFSNRPAGTSLVDLLLTDAARRLADLLAWRRRRPRRPHRRRRPCRSGRRRRRLASMKAPVMISCSACSTPITRGRRCVPPAPGMMPSLISGRPSWRTSLRRDAVVAAERQLQAAAQRRAVDGCNHRLGGGLDLVDQLRQERLLHRRVNSVMSAPAEKKRPVPVSTMALTPGRRWPRRMPSPARPAGRGPGR